MMDRYTTRKFLVLIAFVPGMLSGCSLSQFSLERTASSILETVGLRESTESQGTEDSVVHEMLDMNIEEEYRLGRSVAARLLAIYPPSASEELNTYVNRVGATVAAASIRPETFGGYHFQIVAGEEPFAFASPGGIILISEGLLQMLRDEDALAAVLAHEVAHVALRHGAKALSAPQLRGELQALGIAAGAIGCNQILQGASLVFGGAVDQTVNLLIERGYSREYEGEADIEAVAILSRSGYDPGALARVLVALEQRGIGARGGWLRTHPSNDDRRDALGEALQKISGRPVVGASHGMEARTHRYLSMIEPGQQ